MTAESVKLWKCPHCDRTLLERSLDFAQRRHAQLVASARCGSLDFVREATWPAYLASLRRCRCGSKSGLKPVPEAALRGQLHLELESVVLQ